MVITTFKVLLLLLLVSIPAVAADVDGEVRAGVRRGLTEPASVQLLKNGAIIAEQFTDLAGRFEFRGIPAGNYTIRIKYAGFKVEEVPLNLGGRDVRSRVPVTLTPVENPSDVSPSTVSVTELNIPRSARKELEEGLRIRSRRDCVGAVPHFRKAVEIYAKYGEALNELGICYKEMGNLAEAEDAFVKAIEYTSTVYAALNLADLYASQRRFPEAEDVIRAESKRNPAEGDPFFALARIYFDQGRMKEAEAAGLEAHSRSHRAADVHLLLAKIYLAANNYPALATQLQTYLDEDPDSPNTEQVRQTLEQLQRQR
jgi:tetratricopeptide (TPR) repeat protein